MEEIIVDARGHLCPTPTLKLARALRLAAPGALIRLLADDPLAKLDVPHFAAGAGVEIIRLEVNGAELSVLVQKPPVRKGYGAPM